MDKKHTKIVTGFKITLSIMEYLGFAKTEKGIVSRNDVLKRVLNTLNLIFVAYVIIFSITERSDFHKHSSNYVLVIITLMEIISSACFVLLCFVIPKLKSVEWLTLLHHLRLIENDFQFNRKKSLLHKEFLVVLVLLLSLIFGVSLMLVQFSRFYIIFIARILNTIFYSVFVYFINFITRILKRSYEMLNKKLGMVTKNSENFESFLVEERKSYLILYNAVRKFNDVFGGQIFFVNITTVMVILNCVSHMLHTKVSVVMYMTSSIISILVYCSGHVVSNRA